MSDMLTCTQILELALDKEKNTHQFYLNAIDKVSDINAKRLFELLAEEEVKHQARLEFELIKSGKTVDTPQDILQLEDLDFTIEVTPDMKPIYLDILAGAIKKEHEAFKLFMGLLPLADSQETRDVLESLIEEEIGHKIILQLKYNAISSA